MALYLQLIGPQLQFSHMAAANQIELNWVKLSLASNQIEELKCIFRMLLLHPFNSLFSRTTWVSQYEKGKSSLDSDEARVDGVLGCSSISWTICKQSAPRSRQITSPTPNHWIFTGQMLFLMPNQQCQSAGGNESNWTESFSFLMNRTSLLWTFVLWWMVGCWLLEALRRELPDVHVVGVELPGLVLARLLL